MSKIVHFKVAAFKAAIVLVPSYLAAYLTEKMVWVVPTLAASSFFAATIGMDETALRRRIDEDDADADETIDESETSHDPFDESHDGFDGS
ncbi:hypothetical protein PGB28_17960 [Primorskyibacter aestuariivivens]|uniref:hypothetical protein n=1 Tax=Primorskyibacter aestuariivivens TaxID=1888912 RepID=UPI002301D10A|nr:hypothetical protein [Primorskyibacter aestuariivivens]MDA7430350.1 hypothetical protein [Primorskyibacter aestuariivivens]